MKRFINLSQLDAFRKFAQLFSLAMIYLLLSGCSHTRPYYRADVADFPDNIKFHPNEIHSRILLIGDAGEPLPNEPVLQTLNTWASENPEKSTIVFLGDNIYPDGIVGNLAEARLRLSRQIDAVKNTGADVLFIPGNHDWARGHPDGVAILKRQEAFVDSAFGETGHFLPQNGCPGPSVKDVGNVRIIALDTQWWIDRVGDAARCEYQSEAAAIDALDRYIAEAGEREVIIVSHHPIRTAGPHGGFFSWKEHIFPLRKLNKALWIPLPIVGSLYPFGRRYLSGGLQDIWGAQYADMIQQLRGVMAKHKPLIYASGHDHSLQVFEDGESSEYMLVSGAGAKKKITRVGHNANTLFAHQHSGIQVLDFFRNGKVLLRIVEPNDPELLFAMWLK